MIIFTFFILFFFIIFRLINFESNKNNNRVININTIKVINKNINKNIHLVVYSNGEPYNSTKEKQ